MRSYAASTHNLRPKKAQTQPSAPLPQAMPSAGAATKPLRPLTAYHMFFQLEREYIIQTAAGPDADPSCHANKSYLPGVPRRYRAIKLNADWYAGPGKRQKRKHRKSHGKIGFLELSRVISKRWATLDSTDPETKRYVSKIAQKELSTYKVEMEEFKEATKHAPTASEKPAPSKPAAKTFNRSQSVTVSPTSSPCASPAPMEMPSLPACQPLPSIPSLSLDQDFTISDAIVGLKDEIDYSICSMDRSGHYLPSPSPVFHSADGGTIAEGSINDPLFEWIDGFVIDQHPPVGSSRCVSPVVSEKPADAFSDNDLLQLLSSVRS